MLCFFVCLNSMPCAVSCWRKERLMRRSGVGLSENCKTGFVVRQTVEHGRIKSSWVNSVQSARGTRPVWKRAQYWKGDLHEIYKELVSMWKSWLGALGTESVGMARRGKWRDAVDVPSGPGILPQVVWLRNSYSSQLCFQGLSICHCCSFDTFFWSIFCHSEGQISGKLLAWLITRSCCLVEVGTDLGHLVKSVPSPSHFSIQGGWSSLHHLVSS